ncbi:MAG: hypothetical protein RSG07_02090 [Erysipelotrichaceae bacterium]
MNEKWIEDYDEVIEVVKKKNRGKLFETIDLLSYGVASAADAIDTGFKVVHFLCRKGNSIELLAMVDNKTTKTEVTTINSLDNFKKIVIGEFVYKKYRIIK